MYNSSQVSTRHVRGSVPSPNPAFTTVEAAEAAERMVEGEAHVVQQQQQQHQNRQRLHYRGSSTSTSKSGSGNGNSDGRKSGGGQDVDSGFVSAEIGADTLKGVGFEVGGKSAAVVAFYFSRLYLPVCLSIYLTSLSLSFDLI